MYISFEAYSYRVGHFDVPASPANMIISKIEVIILSVNFEYNLSSARGGLDVCNTSVEYTSIYWVYISCYNLQTHVYEGAYFGRNSPLYVRERTRFVGVRPV